MNALIQALLINVIIPEVAALLRREPGKTDAEILAEVSERAARVIAVGEQWLATKGITLPPNLDLVQPLPAAPGGGQTDG